MSYTARHAEFENRYDAGRRLAALLKIYGGQSSVVVAVPNGGVPVAMEVALALGADLDLVISRKIPLPLMPEAGFGAVADDGTIILNDEMVARLELTPKQINGQVSRVRSEIRKRILMYRKDRPLTVISGKQIIIVDDGLASGYTMMAAVESIRRRRPREIIVAVPAASENAISKVEQVADAVVTVKKDSKPKFYVADYYQYWSDLTDDETINCLKEWRSRRFRSRLNPLF